MPYIGNPSAQRFTSPRAASVFSGDGSTVAFTLEEAVTTDEDILVSVDGVIQEPSVAYAVSSGTTLTFTAAPSSNSGNNIFVYYIARTFGSVSMPDGQNVNAATLNTSGNVVHNEASADVDFRVESNGNANMLFVDGGNDQVGIGTNAMNSYYAKDLVLSAVNQGGITIVGGTSDSGQYLAFADGTSGSDRFRGFLQYAHDTNSMMFASNGSERIRIDSAGVVMFAGTDDDPVFNNTVGASIGSNNGSALAGVGQFNCSGGVALRASRSNEKGATIAIHDQGTQRATLGTVSTADVYFGCDRGAGIRISDQELMPCNATGAFNNDAVDLGHASSFFDDIRATNGTIITSDRNNKQDIEELNDAEKKVATACKGLLRKFRWKSKVEEKGDNARTHFGIIAQDLQDAFTAEGLDAGKYAMFISDTWWAKDDEVWMNESDAPSDATKITKLGVRYTELLAFIISAI